MWEVIKGIEYLHRNNIIHRDIKTKNILVYKKEGGIGIKICDFGLSINIIDNMSLNVTTLYYRAPEILLGKKKYNEKMDIWSIGCVFTEIMTGNILLKGENEIDQIYKIFNMMGTPNNENWRDIEELPYYRKSFPYFQNKINKYISKYTKSDEFIDLISKILVYDPEKRLSSYEIMIHPYFKNFNGTNFVNSLYCHDKLLNIDPYNYYKQNNINPYNYYNKNKNNYIRVIVCDWLFEIICKLKLSFTVYVNSLLLFDSYQTISPSICISSKNLHNIALACCYLSSKLHQDSSFTSLHSFISISPYSYKSSDIYSIELLILQNLDYNLPSSNYSSLILIYCQNYPSSLYNLTLYFFLSFLSSSSSFLYSELSIIRSCFCFSSSLLHLNHAYTFSFDPLLISSLKHHFTLLSSLHLFSLFSFFSNSLYDSVSLFSLP